MKIIGILSGKGGVGKSLSYSDYISLSNGNTIQIGPYIDKLIKEKLSGEILKVTYLYVGQGDATLIRDLRPGGKVMLIDGGPSPEVDEYSSSVKLQGINFTQKVIIPYLEKEGISKIDYVIISHIDGDHIGGLPYLIRNFSVDSVFYSGPPISSPYSDELLAAIKENKKIKYEIFYMLENPEKNPLVFLGHRKLFRNFPVLEKIFNFFIVLFHFLGHNLLLSAFRLLP